MIYIFLKGGVVLLPFIAASVTSFEVSTETVQPILDAINSGLSTLVPIGIGIMGTFVGISLIKRVIFTFL